MKLLDAPANTCHVYTFQNRFGPGFYRVLARDEKQAKAKLVKLAGVHSGEYYLKGFPEEMRADMIISA